jgi:hypothetical protein
MKARTGTKPIRFGFNGDVRGVSFMRQA